eukprot:SAG22_NODE_475_length_10003_cov_3.943356_3_plen_76_part_00
MEDRVKRNKRVECDHRQRCRLLSFKVQIENSAWLCTQIVIATRLRTGPRQWTQNCVARVCKSQNLRSSDQPQDSQ